jgi:hypothetical protein
MVTGELLQLIDSAFEEAGKKNDWLYKSYTDLRKLNKLAHFQIFKMNWFNGASRILLLIDELHTQMTSREDFISVAKLLNLEIDENESKDELARNIKKHNNWRVKFFELEQMQNLSRRKEQLKPLYDKLKQFGYMTELLPRQIKYKLWVLDVINQYGEIETIYLNESSNGKILIQSTYNDYIGILSDMNSVFSEKI